MSKKRGENRENSGEKSEKEETGTMNRYIPSGKRQTAWNVDRATTRRLQSRLGS